MKTKTWLLRMVINHETWWDFRCYVVKFLLYHKNDVTSAAPQEILRYAAWFLKHSNNQIDVVFHVVITANKQRSKIQFELGFVCPYLTSAAHSRCCGGRVGLAHARVRQYHHTMADRISIPRPGKYSSCYHLSDSLRLGGKAGLFEQW